MLLTLWRVAAALAATAVAALTLRSALRTIVVPRGIPDRLTRVVFRVLDAPIAWRAERASSDQLERRAAPIIHVGPGSLGRVFVPPAPPSGGNPPAGPPRPL
jgi:hypothetical protein